MAQKSNKNKKKRQRINNVKKKQPILSETSKKSEITNENIVDEKAPVTTDTSEKVILPDASNKEETQEYSENKNANKPDSPKKVLSKKKKVILSIVASILAIVLVIGSTFVINLVQAVNSLKNEDTPEAQAVDDIGNKPFNVLFIGLGTNGDDGEQPLADSINLFSINPKENFAEAIAIPRDSYLPFGKSCEWGVGYFDKITHATNVSVQCLQDTLSDVFGTEINYFVSINFVGFVDIIDALGGIEMNVPDLVDEFMVYEEYPVPSDALKNGKQWCEHNSKRKRYAVCFDKFGKQLVNGEQALALARTRHFDGDAARNLRQTEMIKAIIAKATSVESIPSMNALLKVVGKAINTNIPPSQFLSFFQLAQRMLNAEDVEDAFSMRTTQLAGYDEYMYGDRIGEELYFRVVPTGSIYNISKKLWHTTHDGETVISPETFDFDIDKENTIEGENFINDPLLHDESVYDYSMRTD